MIAIPWFGGIVGGNTVSAASPADAVKWLSDVSDGVRKEIASFKADVVVAHSAGAMILHAILPELLNVRTVVTFGARFLLTYGDKRILALVGDADELVDNTDGCTIVPNCGHLSLIDEQAWHSSVSHQAQMATNMNCAKRFVTFTPRPDVIATIATMIKEFSVKMPVRVSTPKSLIFCRCWQ